MSDVGVSVSMAARIVGIEVHTLRYWMREFPDSLKPQRDGGKVRFRSEDVHVAFTIKRLLRDEMFSVAGARKYLKSVVNP